MPDPHPAEQVAASAYSSIFSSATIGVAIWNHERRLVSANNALGALFGFAPADAVLARPVLEDFVPADQRGAFATTLVEVARTQGSRMFEIGDLRNGRRWSAVGTAIGARAIGGGLCLFLDVSDRAYAQPRGNDVSSRMSAIAVLSGAMAHEINNPLAYAMGNLSFAVEQLEARATGSPELDVVVLALRDALDGTERVRRTVRDLKIFSRPDSMKMGPVDLDKILTAACSMARSEMQGRARLSADLPTLPQVTGSEGHLAQVFLTLLLHSVENVIQGRPDAREVRVKAARSSSSSVTVDIQCAGAGEEQPPGSMALPASANEELPGFGLAFCRNVVETCGGEMFADRTATGSLGFRVTLPISLHTAETRRPSAWRDDTAWRAKVLVVDDEPRIGTAIARILGPGHEITAVHSAEEALAHLERGEEYDVILCDVVMPKMSGPDLYRAIESRVPRFSPRVVFMTGGPLSTRGSEVPDNATNAHLEKPFSPEAIRDAVARFAPRRG